MESRLQKYTISSYYVLTLIQNYFGVLLQEGNFNPTVLSDQIALLAIYIPVLRTQIQSFVRTWNIHSIRKQRNRPNVTPGKPFILYHHPPPHIQNQGLSIDSETLRELQNDVQEWSKLFQIDLSIITNPYQIQMSFCLLKRINGVEINYNPLDSIPMSKFMKMTSQLLIKHTISDFV